MEDFSCFEVCRVCVTPKTIIPLTTLYDEDGEKARQLKLVSGIDITIDAGKRSAMICDGCSERVKQALILRTEIIDSEEQYFKILRDEEEQEAGGSSVNLEVPEAGGSEELVIKQDGEEAGGSGEVNAEESVSVKQAGGSGELNAEESVSVKQGEDAKKFSMETDSFSQKCKICHKTFKGKYGIRSHLATVHDEGARFKCDHCCKMFYFKSTLNAHIAKNKDCVKYYQKLPEVKTHKKGDRPFQCSKCDKSFKNRQKMHNHRQSHEL